jgi:hypothetical protein
MAEAVDLSGVGGDFEPFPAGIYHVMLTGYEERETGENTKHPENEYFNVEFTVQSGEYEGRKLWTNMMLPPYQPFVLKQLVAAAGRDVNEPVVPEDFLEEMDGKLECNARVKVKKATKEYDARNEIAGFKPFDPEKLSSGSGGKSSSFAP